MSALTAETVLRELFAYGAYDEDADVPMSRIIEMAEAASINLHPCYTCYQHDHHAEGCKEARCVDCGCIPCRCDHDYETSEDK